MERIALRLFLKEESLLDSNLRARLINKLLYLEVSYIDENDEVVARANQEREMLLIEVWKRKDEILLDVSLKFHWNSLERLPILN